METVAEELAAGQEFEELLAAVKSTQRSPNATGAIWDWCQKMSARLIGESGAGVTGLGARVLGSLVTVLADHRDILGPQMLAWLKEQVLPALLKPSNVSNVRSDLAYLLMDAVLHHMLLASANAPRRRRMGKRVRST